MGRSEEKRKNRILEIKDKGIDIKSSTKESKVN